MFTPGFSEELERPDDFHDKEAGRRSRRTKLPARRLVAHQTRRGRLEAGERTRNKTVRGGTGARPRRTVNPDEHQESELLNRT